MWCSVEYHFTFYRIIDCKSSHRHTNSSEKGSLICSYLKFWFEQLFIALTPDSQTWPSRWRREVWRLSWCEGTPPTSWTCTWGERGSRGRRRMRRRSSRWLWPQMPLRHEGTRRLLLRVPREIRGGTDKRVRGLPRRSHNVATTQNDSKGRPDFRYHWGETREMRTEIVRRKDSDLSVINWKKRLCDVVC